nr:T9SS type A sorting domain-containing protein [Bacteroidota bacterium]
FTALDLADDGIYGSFYTNTGGYIHLHQDASNYIDLNGNLIFSGGGEIHVYGGSMRSWWPYTANASLTMNGGGILDFHDNGIYIYNSPTYGFEYNIDNGTIRTAGGFESGIPDFNPSSGIVELYGPDDASLALASGSTLNYLTINKDDVDGVVGKSSGPVYDKRNGDLLSDGSRSYNVSLQSDVTIDKDLEISAGSFTLNGHELTVDDDCLIYGNLVMDNVSDILNCGNQIFWHDGSTEEVSEGVINLDYRMIFYDGSNIQLGTGNTLNLIGTITTAIRNFSPLAEIGNLNVDMPGGSGTCYISYTTTHPVNVVGDMYVAAGNLLEIQGYDLIVDGELHIDNTATVSLGDIYEGGYLECNGYFILDGTLNVDYNDIIGDRLIVECDDATPSKSTSIENLKKGNITENRIWFPGEVSADGNFTFNSTGVINILGGGSFVWGSGSTSGIFPLAGILNLDDGSFEVPNRHIEFQGMNNISGGQIIAGQTIVATDPGTFQPTGGNVELIGSDNLCYIRFENGNFMHSLIVNRVSPIGLHGGSSLEVKNDVDIISGALESRSLPIYVGGNWTNNVGDEGFDQEEGTVYFNGIGILNSQFINGDTFYNLENDNLQGTLHIAGPTVVENDFVADNLNLVSGPTLDVDGILYLNTGELALSASAPFVYVNEIALGGVLTVTSGVLNVSDIDDSGIHGTLNLYSGLVNFTQVSGWVDFWGLFLDIDNAWFNIFGGDDDSWWGNNVEVVMNGGSLNFNDRGIWIKDNFTESISGGTIKSYGSFQSDVAEFTPTGGIVEMTGPDDAIINMAAGAQFYNLMINKSGAKENGYSPYVKTDRNGNAIENSRSNSVGANGDFGITNDLIVETGVFTLNGQTIEVANDVSVNDEGILNINDNAQLLLGDASLLNVNDGGRIEIIGSIGNEATISHTSGYYYFTVNEGGTIAANHTIFEYMGTMYGIHIAEGAFVDPVNTLSNCTFRNGDPLPSVGSLLSINNNQDLTISNASFPTTGTDHNVAKDWDFGNVTFEDFTGIFAGEDFDWDPYGRIDWYTGVPGLWTGIASSDWFDSGNWSDGNVPNATTDVTIPNACPNYPLVSGITAYCRSIVVESGAELEIGNTTLSTEFSLEINGNLTMNNAAGIIECNSIYWYAGSTDNVTAGEIHAKMWEFGDETNAKLGTGNTAFVSMGLNILDADAEFGNLNIVDPSDGTTEMRADYPVRVTGNCIFQASSPWNMMGGLIVDGNLLIAGVANVSFPVWADISVGGDFDLAGTLTLNTSSDLTVDGNLELSGELYTGSPSLITVHTDFIFPSTGVLSLGQSTLTCDNTTSKAPITLNGELITDIMSEIHMYPDLVIGSSFIDDNINGGHFGLRGSLTAIYSGTFQLANVSIFCSSPQYPVANNIDIQVTGTNYLDVVTMDEKTFATLIDDLTVNGDLHVIDGALNVGSNTLTCGGDASIYNASLSIGDNGQLLLSGSSILTIGTDSEMEIIGSAGNEALVSHSSGYYEFNINSGGTISANHAIFEYMGTEHGINVKNGAIIDATNNFSDCIFRNGDGSVAGAALLTIDNNQTLTIANASFPTAGTSYNVAKSLNQGNITFEGFTGIFSGEDYDNDPFNRIDWYVPALSVTPSIRNVSAPAGTTTFNVTSNLSWTVAESVPWFSVVPMSGSNNGTLTVNYSENLSLTGRSGQITVSAPGAPDATVTVNQAGATPELAVTPPVRNVSAASGSTTFDVASNTSWTVSESVSWFTVAPMNGSGNDVLTVNYLENTSVTPRSGSITVSAAGVSDVIVTVNQAGASPELTVTPLNQNVSADLELIEFEITSNTNWTVTEDEDWIIVSPGMGSGNETLDVTCMQNLTGTPRVGDIVVTAGGGSSSVTVTVTQETWQTHDISFVAGWTGLSSYIMPAYNDIVNVFAPLNTNFIIAQTMSGIYYPTDGINTIGTWASQSAYKVKIAADETLTIVGDEENNKVYAMGAGWNLVPVICNTPVDAGALFAFTDLEILKDVAGTGIMWPDYSINTIGDMLPGLAYFALLNSAGTVTFPLNTDNVTLGKRPVINFPSSPWNEIVLSPSTHIIAVPHTALQNVMNGDVLGILTPENVCAGLTQIGDISQNVALTAFADDMITEQKEGFEAGDQMIFKLFRPGSDEIFSVSATFDPALPNQGNFANDGLSAMVYFKTESLGIAQTLSDQISIYPNPTNEIAWITGVGAFDEIVMMNSVGNEIFRMEINGQDKVKLDLKTLSSGIYQVKLISHQMVLVKKIVKD